MSNIELTLTPTRVIGLTLTAPAQGSIEFAPATAGITLQLAPFFKGDKGDAGDPSPGLATINFAYGDANRIIIPALTSKIVLAFNINITTPFNGAGASLSIGTLASPALLVAQAQLDLSVATEFEINPNVKFTTPTDIYLTINPGAGATQGAGWIVVEAATFN